MPTPAAKAERQDDWAPAVRQRRKALLQRLGMGATTALVFSPLFGWPFSLLWVLNYFAVQMLDMAIFAPINSGRTERMGRARTVLGGAMLFLNAACFGSLALPLWINGGAMGGVCAAILLCSGAIYGVVNSPRSKSVLLLTVTPHVLYLGLTPVFMLQLGAPPAFATAVGVALVIFAAYCFNTWERLDEAFREAREAREAAMRQRDEAERAMESRAAFVAAIGHDLRTPISAILTGADEMQRQAIDASARAHAALITDAGLMMKALLDDMLDHAKLEAGRMTVEAVDFDARALVAQTVRLWKGPLKAKGLRLCLEGAHSVPAALKGDPMRLRQVLNNLISNAVKFTEEGCVTLRLRSWPEEPGGHALTIEVIDTGPGMTREQMARLFTPFDQLDDAVSARHGGTGLGLAISRDLAQLMGGRLTARSRPGEGAAFTVSLSLPAADNAAVLTRGTGDIDRGAVTRALGPVAPAAAVAPTAALAAAPAPVAAEAAEEADGDEGRALRVLVVDDHDINRRAVELILAPLGCDIATAENGLIALQIAGSDAFDVIFMDVRMPELDGRETTRRLRAGRGPNAATPVIAVTADSQPEDIAACMASGMTYFVSKPLTPGSLLGALQHVLEGGSMEEAQASVAA